MKKLVVFIAIMLITTVSGCTLVYKSQSVHFEQTKPAMLNIK